MTITKSMDRETPGIKGEEVSTDERPDRVGDVELTWGSATVAGMHRDAVKIGHVMWTGIGWKACPSHLGSAPTVAKAVECFVSRKSRKRRAK